VEFISWSVKTFAQPDHIGDPLKGSLWKYKQGVLPTSKWDQHEQNLFHSYDFMLTWTEL